MPHRAITAANYLRELAVAKHGAEGHDFSPMKAQKLVWYAHGWHLGLDGRLLVDDEQAEAWDWGPVFPSLYYASRRYGNGPITAPLVPADPHDLAPAKRLPPDEAFGEDAPKVRQRLARTFDLYDGYTAIQLSNSTHDPGTPWHDVFKVRYAGRPPRGTDIDPELIRTYFSDWARTGRQPGAATARCA